jgi:hypothetical protein
LIFSGFLFRTLNYLANGACRELGRNNDQRNYYRHCKIKASDKAEIIIPLFARRADPEPI